MPIGSRRALAFCVVVALGVAACSSKATDASTDKCAPDDADGIVGGKVTLALAVSDDAFSPVVVKAQNTATVTLTLSNTGTKAHGFALDCLPTPNDDGCP